MITPKPWVWEVHSDYSLLIGADGNNICERPLITHDDMYLLESAPDLLESCEDLLYIFIKHGDNIMKAHATKLDNARKAIQKAHGKKVNELLINTIGE